MNKKQLIDAGLTEEQADAVFEMHGKDIEKLKTAAEADKAAQDNLTTQLAEATQQIENFKGMDIEGVKAAAEEYKTKAAQAKIDADAQVASLKYDHALSDALTSAKAINKKALRALLDEKTIKLKEDNTFEGLDDQITKLRESDPNQFHDETVDPHIVAGAQSHSVIGDKAVDAARTAAGLPGT